MTRDDEADDALLHELAAANADRFGPAPPGYEIVEPIRRGAQGAVYRAVQRSTRRLVALKIAHGDRLADAGARARFLREAELAASLRHPGIVVVHDSGADDAGRAWIAMELVDGEPLDAWLRERNPPRRARLELFARICDAVAHAHARAVVHRDLKPSNILVDRDGAPRVLDFGIAKALAADGERDLGTTQAGEFVGTFAYAAPEQVSGDPARIDTRTDQYALGVLLHEMLAGARPIALEGPLKAVVDAIEHAPPVPLGRVVPDLDPDLETIALRALAKDPERRYPSTSALAADVRAVLDGRPIEARRDEAIYVLRRLVARHRVAAAVAAGVAVLLAAAGAAVLVQARLAERRAELASRALVSLVDLVAQIDQENPEGEPPALDIADLLDDASRIAHESLLEFPELAVPVLGSIGRSYLSRARFDEAERDLERARALAEAASDAPTPALAACLHDLGRLAWKRADFAAAESFYRRALDLRRALLPADHPDVARTLHHLAATRRARGDLDEAESLYRVALAMRERTLPADHPDIANTLNGLATCLFERARYADAVDVYRRAVAAVGARYGPEDWRAARARSGLGAALAADGRLAEARVELEGALATKRRTRADDPADIAGTELELARLELTEDRLEPAAALVATARSRLDEALPDDHPSRAAALALDGEIRLARGDVDGAVAALEPATAALRANLGADHWRTALAEAALGRALRRAGRPGEGDALLDRAKATLARVHGPDAPTTRRVRGDDD